MQENFIVCHDATLDDTMVSLLTGGDWLVSISHSANNRSSSMAIYSFVESGFYQGGRPSQLAYIWYSDLSLYYKCIPSHATISSGCTHEQQCSHSYGFVRTSTDFCTDFWTFVRIFFFLKTIFIGFTH